MGAEASAATVSGAQTFQRLGVGVGAGDLNGDGYDDLIAGSLGRDAALVVFGRSGL